MWSPADKYTAISNKDDLNAQEAIGSLKRQIIDAAVPLLYAQGRIDKLTSDMREPETLIAPERRLNYDVLAIVFIMCAEDEWMAPLRIASVCRFWRETVLCTPQTWSFIDIHHPRALSLLPLFAERSGQCGFHIWLSKWHNWEYISAVGRITGKIKCLVIPDLKSNFVGKSFPLLEHLRLCYFSYGAASLLPAKARFPRLRHLEINGALGQALVTCDDLVEFPTLQTLRISVSNNPSFLCILKRCGESLTYLRLRIRRGATLPLQCIISLPQLENLTFEDFRSNTPFNIPQMITPVLERFNIWTSYDSASFPMEMDLGKLTCVRAEGRQIPPLSSLRGIVVLQLRLISDILTVVLGLLQQEPSICPQLRIIEIHDEQTICKDSGPLGMLSKIANRRRGIKVVLKEVDMEWDDSLPAIDIYQVSMLSPGQYRHPKCWRFSARLICHAVAGISLSSDGDSTPMIPLGFWGVGVKVG